jgi:hypothetical protein
VTGANCFFLASTLALFESVRIMVGDIGEFENELYPSDAGGITCNCKTRLDASQSTIYRAGVLGASATQMYRLCLQGPTIFLSRAPWNSEHMKILHIEAI